MGNVSAWGSRSRDAAAAVLLATAAAAVAAILWTQPTRWMPDGFFYRAQVLRILGAEKEEALETVFNGRLTLEARRAEAGLRPFERKLSNPEWVRESAQFYERRRVVPLLAAPLDGPLGPSGLRFVSLAGYVLLAPLLYFLLRLWLPLRFALPAAAAAALLVEPLRTWSSSPLTDSFGLALMTAALACGCLTLTRSPRWLAGWAAAILVLGFTRDLTVVVVGAATLAFLVERTRLTGVLALTGALAAAPAPLVFGVPLRAAIAYPLAGYYPVDNPSWSYIGDRYLDGVKTLVKANLSYLADRPLVALLLVGGTIAIVLLRPPGPARTLVWSAVPAALGYVLLTPNDTDFRLELAFLPLAALGLGSAALRLESLRRARAPGEEGVREQGRGAAE